MTDFHKAVISVIGLKVVGLAKTLGFTKKGPRVIGIDIDEVANINKEQPMKLLQLLKKHTPSLKGKTIGILGLAFKPDTDDVRGSKAIEIVQELLKLGARVITYDPKAMPNFMKVFSREIEYSSPEIVLKSDAALILTAWDEFNNFDYTKLIVIDGRYIIKAKEARVYEGICW